MPKGWLRRLHKLAINGGNAMSSRKLGREVQSANGAPSFSLSLVGSFAVGAVLLAMPWAATSQAAAETLSSKESPQPTVTVSTELQAVPLLEAPHLVSIALFDLDSGALVVHTIAGSPLHKAASQNPAVLSTQGALLAVAIPAGYAHRTLLAKTTYETNSSEVVVVETIVPPAVPPVDPTLDDSTGPPPPGTTALGAKQQAFAISADALAEEISELPVSKAAAAYEALKEEVLDAKGVSK
jgi:hypothetical protein